jgi:hypothetical protein
MAVQSGEGATLPVALASPEDTRRLRSRANLTRAVIRIRSCLRQVHSPLDLDLAFLSRLVTDVRRFDVTVD